MRVGIVGCGAIGAVVARAAARMEGVSSLVLYDIDPDATKNLGPETNATIAASGEALIDEVDLVIECANKGVVQALIPSALGKGKNVMLLSIGAMGNDELRSKLVELAKANAAKIYLPSGAIMGVDGIRGAMESGLKSVTLVTTKPNEGLDKNVDKWTLVWSGSARDAVEAFPKNVNVAAAISMAGLGFDETWVQVAADPLATRNSHKLILEGDFGRARIEVENLPSPDNPRTSHLAALSTIALLRRILSPIEVGS